MTYNEAVFKLFGSIDFFHRCCSNWGIDPVAAAVKHAKEHGLSITDKVVSVDRKWNSLIYACVLVDNVMVMCLKPLVDDSGRYYYYRGDGFVVVSREEGEQIWKEHQHQ